MTGNVEYDVRRMFKHACAFTDCAIFCQKAPNSIVVRTQWYTIPEIVNSAFACEVFIKSLLLHHGMTLEEIRRKNHGLKGLWKAFRETDATSAARVEYDVTQPFNSQNPDFFDDMLDIMSEAFKEWRYIYEGHGACINMNFLIIFRNRLRSFCCESYYQMTWSEYESRGHSSYDSDTN